MKVLSNEVKSLLDKLYNLRGEDSIILAKMNKEREEAIETGERTKNEKTILLEKIEKLTKEEETLQEEGKKLTSILSNINRDDFATILDRLQIDFDPASINEKVNSMLPETIEKVVTENKKASEELESVEAEMNNAITKVEELGIRKDEALSNQAKLNEYFDLALEGNINITRDAITSLLEKFDFNEDEQREAAKILMFPEDALYEYDATYKSGGAVNGKTITEVLMEAKKESTSNKEKMDTKELDTSLESSSLEDIFDKVIDENKIEEIESPVENKNIEVKEEHQEEIKPLFSSDESLSNLSNENKEKKIEKEDVIKLLESLNVNTAKLVTEEINKLLENYDEELIKKNVSSLKESNIDLNVINSNIEILLDKELKAKVDKLLSIGKEARDISLAPSVLKKYDLQGLNNTISVLELSGLDPKKVPLMAY
mgnify:FL=1